MQYISWIKFLDKRYATFEEQFVDFWWEASIISPSLWSLRTDFISESLLASMFTFLLISIRVKK